MNRGNLALMQQQDKGAVFMQQQGKGSESARQEVIIQQFADKSANSMEEKLSLALEKAN